MIGQTVGHYRILERLGGGGMGVVYKAEDTRLGRRVALKFLPEELARDREAVERFEREARAASALDHPNICVIYEIGEHDGQPFIVMQYLEGQTLKQRVARGGLESEEVARLGLQVAEALEAAHRKGIVHRDIKPANLFLTSDAQVKVLDFGLAKLARPAGDLTATDSLTQTGVAPGTLPYMAPEQVRGKEVDGRADVYAAGCVLYELATGQRAFAETQGAELIDAILHLTPVPPSGLNRRVAAELERIILKCLEKDAGMRYQSAKELAVDLRRLIAPSAIPLAPSPQAPAWGRLGSRWQVPPGSARLFVRFGGAALAAVLVVAGLVAFNVGGVRERLFGAPAPQIDSLAVLPLKNLSGDPEQEYFVEGM
ncbi:MAG: protein kinase, partial [Acidobacteria bacterium]|nr:protein kinase [Acidobacteriota bacterium]